MAHMRASHAIYIAVAMVFGWTAAAPAQPVGYEGWTAPLSDATPTGSSYMLTDAWGGGYSDTEKSPLSNDDDMMCWAAAAANVLDWTGWGHVDDGTGHVLSSADEIFGYFQDHWTDVGGMMGYGWDWWFDGTNDSQGSPGWSQVDVPGGGFHPTAPFDQYFYRVTSDADALWAIDSFLRMGFGAAAAIYRPNPSGGLYGHAITLWGVNYEPTAPVEYLGVWISDSDDDKHLASPPDRLRYYEVAFSGGKWRLQDYDNRDSWYFGSVEALAAPEPATATLVTIGALCLLRRRRGR